MKKLVLNVLQIMLQNDELSNCININDIDYENCEKENNRHNNCYYNQIENCKIYFNIKKENCSECEDGY
jgi:hypothetical protein